MKFKKQISLLHLLASFAAYGQTDTTDVIYYDTASIQEMEMISEPPPLPLFEETVPAVPYDEYIEYNPISLANVVFPLPGRPLTRIKDLTEDMT